MFRWDRFDELVKESGKTKTYLSKKINKCATYFRDTKKQNGKLKGADLDIIAAELDCAAEYLTGETDIKKTAPGVGDGLEEEIREIIQLLNEASPELRAAALAVLKSAGGSK